MTIGIVLPVFCRTQELIDLTYQTVESIQTEEDVTLVVMVNRQTVVTPESFRQELAARFYTHTKGVRRMIVNADKERCVAGTWNRGIEILQEHTYGLEFIAVINNDIVLQPDTLDTLIGYGRTAPWHTSLWSAVNTRDVPDPGNDVSYEGADYSCYMIRPNFVEQHGRFDENFVPAYYEDNDMSTRIIVGSRKIATVNSARYWHHGSRTITFDATALQRNGETFGRNGQYYARKWGVFPPPTEPTEIRDRCYPRPFNDMTKPLSWWPDVPPERAADFW